jgi:hypothetical protein
VTFVEIGQEIEVALVVLDGVAELRDLGLDHLLLRGGVAMTLSTVDMLQVDHVNLCRLNALSGEEKILLGHRLAVVDIEEFVEVFEEENVIRLRSSWRGKEHSQLEGRGGDGGKEPIVWSQI